MACFQFSLQFLISTTATEVEVTKTEFVEQTRNSDKTERSLRNFPPNFRDVQYESNVFSYRINFLILPTDFDIFSTILIERIWH